MLPERAAWIGDFQVEVLQFPQGRFDDQVDSLSQFLAWRAKERYQPRWAPVRTREEEHERREPRFYPVGFFRL